MCQDATIKPLAFTQKLPIYQAANQMTSSGGAKVGQANARNKNDRPVLLAANENPFGPGTAAIAACRASLDSLHRYPDSHYHGLRDALAVHYGGRADDYATGVGSSEVLSLLCRAFVGPGLNIVHSEHGFLMYPLLAQAVGATPLAAKDQTSNGAITTDPDAILAGVTERTRLVILANPNNPTGTLLHGDALEYLLDRLPPHVLLVLDEAYGDYVWSSVANQPGLARATDVSGHKLLDKGRTLAVVGTFSKLFGLAGLRVGWIRSFGSVIDTIQRLRSPFNLAAPAAQAAIAALSDHDHIRASLLGNEQGIRRLETMLPRYGIQSKPTFCNYTLAECASPEHADHVFHGLKDQGVLVRRMGTYGLPSHLRITIGTPTNLDRLEKALDTVITSETVLNAVNR